MGKVKKSIKGSTDRESQNDTMKNRKGSVHKVLSEKSVVNKPGQKKRGAKLPDSFKSNIINKKKDDLLKFKDAKDIKNANFKKAQKSNPILSNSKNIDQNKKPNKNVTEGKPMLKVENNSKELLTNSFEEKNLKNSKKSNGIVVPTGQEVQDVGPKKHKNKKLAKISEALSEVQVFSTKKEKPEKVTEKAMQVKKGKDGQSTINSVGKSEAKVFSTKKEKPEKVTEKNVDTMQVKKGKNSQSTMNSVGKSKNMKQAGKGKGKISGGTEKLHDVQDMVSKANKGKKFNKNLKPSSNDKMQARTKENPAKFGNIIANLLDNVKEFPTIQEKHDKIIAEQSQKVMGKGFDKTQVKNEKEGRPLTNSLVEKTGNSKKAKKRNLIGLEEEKSGGIQDIEPKAKKSKKKVENLDFKEKAVSEDKVNTKQTQKGIGKKLNKKQANKAKSKKNANNTKASNNLLFEAGVSLKSILPPFDKEEFYEVVKSDNITKVVKTLKELVSQEVGQKKSQIFTDYRYMLNITYFKIPSCPNRFVKLQLKNALVDEEDDVCLIVKDLQRGSKFDYEPTIHHYEDLLKAKGVKGIKTILPFNQLKKEYGNFELRRKLSNLYDYFICDAAIVGHVVGFLGKIFQKSRCVPHAVRMGGKDIAREITKSLHKTCFRQGKKGTLIAIPVGTHKMSPEKVTENILKVMSQLENLYPGGLPNMRKIYVKIDIKGTSAIPMYISPYCPPEDVPFIVGPREEKLKKLKAEVNNILSKFKMTATGDLVEVGEENQEEQLAEQPLIKKRKVSKADRVAEENVKNTKVKIQKKIAKSNEPQDEYPKKSKDKKGKKKSEADLGNNGYDDGNSDEENKDEVDPEELSSTDLSTGSSENTAATATSSTSSSSSSDESDSESTSTDDVETTDDESDETADQTNGVNGSENGESDDDEESDSEESSSDCESSD